MNNKTSEMKNTLAEHWGRRADKWPEDRMVGITAVEQNLKRVKRNEDSLRDIWGIKHISIPHYRGGLRRRERGRIWKKIQRDR